MKLMLYGFFALIVFPIFSYSVEPKDPADACDRFLNDKDKSKCLKKTQSTEIDWYASSLCEKINDDILFFSCFDSIRKNQYEPKAIETCEKIGQDDETQKVHCLEKIKNRVVGHCTQSDSMKTLESCLQKQSGRLPASQKNFFQKK